MLIICTGVVDWLTTTATTVIMCHVDHHNSFIQNINSCLNPTPSFKLVSQN